MASDVRSFEMGFPGRAMSAFSAFLHCTSRQRQVLYPRWLLRVFQFPVCSFSVVNLAKVDEIQYFSLSHSEKNCGRSWNRYINVIIYRLTSSPLTHYHMRNSNVQHLLYTLYNKVIQFKWVKKTFYLQRVACERHYALGHASIQMGRIMHIVFKTFAISTHAWLESCTPSTDMRQ